MNNGVVLYFIGSFQKKFHEYPGIEEIAEEFGCSPQKAKTTISELKKQGYLDRNSYVEKTKKPKARKKNAR